MHPFKINTAYFNFLLLVKRKFLAKFSSLIFVNNTRSIPTVCREYLTLSRRGISFNQAHFPQGCCGNRAADIFSSLYRGIILKKLHFKTHSRKIGKNVNLFYLNKNNFQIKTQKVSRFFMSLLWKLSLLY